MDFLSKCLFNLHAIGEIPRGQKINTRGDCLSIERESYIQWVKRFADGRSKVFRDINRYVSTVIEISIRIMESKYLCKDACFEESSHGRYLSAGETAGENVPASAGESSRETSRKINHEAVQIRTARLEELQKITEGLLEARRGIVGQQETYKDDIDVCAIILDLTTKIDNHIVMIKKFLQSGNFSQERGEYDSEF